METRKNNYMEKIVDEGPRPAHFRQWTQPTNVGSRGMEITCLGRSLFLDSDILPEGRGGHWYIQYGADF